MVSDRMPKYNPNLVVKQVIVADLRHFNSGFFPVKMLPLSKIAIPRAAH